MNNLKELQILLDKIQEIKRISIWKISTLSGYRTENYLSERMSTKNISDNVIKRVESLYERAKIDSKILNTSYKEKGPPNENSLFEYLKAEILELKNEIRMLRKENVLLENQLEIERSKNFNTPKKTGNVG